ncbi:MAG: hydrogenase maturation protease [Pseudomonadales bacterium]|nr:hydrogenase maturation protease [Pseudomonadales bacterium]
MSAKPRILLIAIGNRSRGDDGVAPVLLERVAGKIKAPANVQIVAEEVYQLQPEHIYDIEAADALLIIDAATDLDANVRLDPIRTNAAAEVGTHTVSPDNLLGLYQSLLEKSPPPSLLLTIKASEFGFTETLSASCQQALDEAERFLLQQLAAPAGLFEHMESADGVARRS